MAKPFRRDRGADSSIPALVASVEDHARAAGKDQPADAVASARLEDIPRGRRIIFIEIPAFHPNAEHSGNVKNAVDAPAGRVDRVEVPQIGGNYGCSQRLHFRRRTPGGRIHPIAPGEKLFDNIPPEEASGAGDKCFHGFVVGWWWLSAAFDNDRHCMDRDSIIRERLIESEQIITVELPIRFVEKA